MFRRWTCLIALVLLALPAAAAPPVALEFHYDVAANASVAVVRATGTNEILARTEWEGRLPLGRDLEGRTVVPTVVLARLRDILDEASSSEGSAETSAAGAAKWVRSFMGDYADAPASTVGDGLLSLIVSREKSWWCGEKTMPDMSCPGDCKPADNSGPKECRGCGCAGEKEWP